MCLEALGSTRRQISSSPDCDCLTAPDSLFGNWYAESRKRLFALSVDPLLASNPEHALRGLHRVQRVALAQIIAASEEREPIFERGDVAHAAYEHVIDPGGLERGRVFALP